MYQPIEISTVRFDPADASGKVLDMTGRCAFALCTRGRLRIKILNEQYDVSERSMFACMPFVNIEIVRVSEPSEVMFGYILIEDVPKLINRCVSTNNLSAIQCHPLIKISDTQQFTLINAIREYLIECEGYESGSHESICSQIERDIVDYMCLLIVAQVLKVFFIYVPMESSGRTRHGSIFQRFMLALYGNFREQRNVQFYAEHSGVSLKYFSTVVRELSGASPSQWIETVVAGEAKSMLNDTQRSIKDIATTLNFPDAPTFTKYFRRVTGMTPKAYRKITE